MTTSTITLSSLDAAKPASRDVFLWDVQTRGFGVKITPAGRKVFLLQYRMGGRGSPTRRYTIGPLGSPWTPDSARKEAKRLLALVLQGVDPAHDKQRARREVVELEFAGYASLFLEQCVRREWLKSYDFADGILRLHVIPHWQRRPLPSISRNDVVRLLDSMAVGKVALRRNTFAVVRRLFSWAEARGDIEKSPMIGMEAPPEATPRDRVLEDYELSVFWRASLGIGYPFGPFYRLLLITGQRREEVGALRWEELRRDARLWKLPKERAKNGKANDIPLVDLAIAELDSVAGGDKWPKSGFVFSTRPKASISGYSKGKVRLDAQMSIVAAADAGDDEAFVIAPWRVHDLRRTVATSMQRLGIRFEVIEALINHTLLAKSKVVAAYHHHDWTNEKADAARIWAAEIERIVSPVLEGSNVVALAERRA